MRDLPKAITGKCNSELNLGNSLCCSTADDNVRLDDLSQLSYLKVDEVVIIIIIVFRLNACVICVMFIKRIITGKGYASTACRCSGQRRKRMVC